MQARKEALENQAKMVELNQVGKEENAEQQEKEQPSVRPQPIFQAPRPMVSDTVAVPRPRRVEGNRAKDQLEEALIRRIAINPKDIEAYERLGDYYLESGSYGDSLECFKQVLMLSPTHQKARMRIRKLEKMIG
jgi:tetratricopeptide (TPR) repeat protein